MWSAAQSEDQQAELPSAVDIASGAAKDVEDAGAVGDEQAPRRTRGRRPAAAMSAAFDARNGSLSTMSASGMACRDRRDVLFVTDAAHLSLRAAAEEARLMATLYHVPTSRSLRVLWTLEEIGATVEVKSLGVRRGCRSPSISRSIRPARCRP